MEIKQRLNRVLKVESEQVPAVLLNVGMFFAQLQTKVQVFEVDQNYIILKDQLNMWNIRYIDKDTVEMSVVNHFLSGYLLWLYSIVDSSRLTKCLLLFKLMSESKEPLLYRIQVLRRVIECAAEALVLALVM